MRQHIALALIAAAVLISGCQQQAPQVDCKTLLKRADADQCFYNKSLSRVNVADCDEIMDAQMKEKCINDLALKLKDYLICKRHDKMVRRDQCELKVAEVNKVKRASGLNLTKV
jgi:hypothetical protein